MGHHHSQETLVTIRKGVLSGGHNLTSGHEAGSSLYCCAVNNLCNWTRWPWGH